MRPEDIRMAPVYPESYVGENEEREATLAECRAMLERQKKCAELGEMTLATLGHHARACEQRGDLTPEADAAAIERLHHAAKSLGLLDEAKT